MQTTKINYEKVARVFGSNAQLKVLVHLMNVQDNEDYLSGIAEATGVSHSSVSRVLKPLIKAGVVTETLFGKTMRVFTINWNVTWIVKQYTIFMKISSD